MQESSLLTWLCPPLCAVLALLVLALMRQRRGEEKEFPRLFEMEDALKASYYLQQDGTVVKPEGLSEAMDVSVEIAKGLLKTLVASGWAEDGDTGISLTSRGEERAQELIRAHRLWERYLLDRKGMHIEAVHIEADQMEHEITPEEAAELDEELDYPAWDPHGDIIPDIGRPVPPPAGDVLTGCEVGEPLKIVRVGNEPSALFAQLLAMGIEPGAEVEIEAREPNGLRIKVGEETVSLASAAAKRVHAVRIPALPVPLNEVPVGGAARVTEIRGHGQYQRRMLDMGLVPGAEVEVVRKAPLGDPVEYRIGDTVIAMRRTDASSVLVEELSGSEHPSGVGEVGGVEGG